MTDRAFLYRKNGEWRWQRRASNHEVVASSTEGYQNRADAVANYHRVSGPDAPELEPLNEDD